MNWFAEELHKQRTAKGISLNEIASITRINIQFLEALEQGNFSVLPQTYIRAFIREYARCVGMDPAELLKRYESQINSASESTRPLQPETAESSGVRESLEAHAWNARRVIIASLLTIVVAVIFYFLVFQPTATESVKKTPFRDVVRETERAVAPKQPSVKPSDSTRSSLPVSVKTDSLILTAITSDKVWMSMIIDGKRTEEYLLPPNSKYSWTAKEKFSLTIGNAGGVQFTMNGVQLESFGKTGSVVRNVILTRETLQSHAPAGH